MSPENLRPVVPRNSPSSADAVLLGIGTAVPPVLTQANR
jgi:hypothetical protein